MSDSAKRRPRRIVIAAIIALAFGVLTIVAGGMALFGSEPAQAAVGNYVPFVLWFNFFAGFAYLLCGTALLLRARWAAWLAVLIAAATIVVAGGFVWHVLAGGAFEMRTAVALALRIAIWTTIATIAMRHGGHAPPHIGTIEK